MNIETSQNKYEKLFDKMLKQMSIEVVRYGKGFYSLRSIDRVLTGGTKAGSIRDAMDVFDCVEHILCDEWLTDLEEEAEVYGVKIDASTFDTVFESAEKLKKGTEQEQKFVHDHQWEIDVLDMGSNHAHEINLEWIETQVAQDKGIHYVVVEEMYRKIVAVMAEDEDDATEKALEAWACGEFGEMTENDYVLDSCDARVMDTNQAEELYERGEIPYLNEEGEAE